MFDAQRKAGVEVDPNSRPSRQAYVEFVKGKSKDEERWWSKDTIAVVTGGNKGIGHEIVKQLASAGVTAVLTARNKSRGEEALSALRAHGLENVLFHQLDVTDAPSAATLACWIKEKFGGLDILIGNAGQAGHDESYETAKNMVSTNFDGQKIVTGALLPLFKPTAAGGRMVYVSSELGRLKVQCLSPAPGPPQPPPRQGREGLRVDQFSARQAILHVESSVERLFQSAGQDARQSAQRKQNIRERDGSGAGYHRPQRKLSRRADGAACCRYCRLARASSQRRSSRWVFEGQSRRLFLMMCAH